MSHFTRTHHLDIAALAVMCRPRDGLVKEHQVTPPARSESGSEIEIGSGFEVGSEFEVEFELDQGPCRSYRRGLLISPPTATDGHYQVREDVTFDLAVPLWGWLVRPVFAFELRRRGSRPGQPWWAPPQRLDPTQASTLARLTVLAICSGYIGTLLSQLTTFAGREFGAGPAAQGTAQATTRAGILVVLIATVVADRLGRRRTLLVALVGACLVSSLTGLSRGMVSFAAIQVVARGLTTGADVLRAVFLAEEMPAGSRAYAISLSAMCAGFGAGMVVWLLPIADTDERAWRFLFAGAVVFAPLAAWAGRGLPESARFLRHRQDTTPIRLRQHRGRLLLLAGSAALTTVFAAPASQLQNEYLRGERGFSAGSITAFTLLTSTPAGLAVFFGGRLADVYGRRAIGALGLVGAAIGVWLSYAFAGFALWAGAVMGTLFGGLVVPTLVIYGPELFPTRLRGRANGLITLAAVCGSVVGLLSVGRLAERFNAFGPAMAFVAVGPVVVAVMVLTLYPETAQRELEELNPTDA